MEHQYQTILEAIGKHSVEYPDKLCVCDKTYSWTYSQFTQLILIMADHLREEGVEKGDVVVIRAVQKTEFLIMAMAIQYVGAIFCPVEKNIADDRIKEISTFVKAKYYIANKLLKWDAVTSISLKQVFKASIEKAELSADISFLDNIVPSGNDTSDILFTTGTTGKSKGIEVTHLTNVAIAENVMDSVQINKNEVDLISTPINHSLAIRRFYGAMLNGSTVVLTDGFLFVEDFFRLIDQYQVTAITFVPAILELVLQYSKDRISSYNDKFHYIQLGSAPLSEKLKEELRELLPHAALYNTYGATESGCTVILDFQKYPDKKKCIGRTTVNTKIHFVDDNKNEVKASAQNPGLLMFEGDMNMKGYIDEPELTKEVLQNGCIYTNDLGYLGEDGLVYLLGRRGDVINMGGLKVAPTEVEEVLMSHEAISDCGCIGIKDQTTGEAIKMFLVLKEGYDFNKDEIMRFMGTKLESYKVPRNYEVIDQIPRTFNGKIIRKQLKEREEK